MGVDWISFRFPEPDPVKDAAKDEDGATRIIPSEQITALKVFL